LSAKSRAGSGSASPPARVKGGGAAEDLPRPQAEARALADRLHSAAIHLLRRLRRQDLATGEGPARLSALSVLVFQGPKTLGQLARAEQVQPPTMSRVVAGLVASRLVEISPDREDARRRRIRASPRGISLLEKARAMRVTELALRLDRLPPAERAQLRETAEILDRLLQEWDR
jgi:DNA-binding MarR family transcriptional regulator